MRLVTIASDGGFSLGVVQHDRILDLPDVGRWPISVFKGALRMVFTFVFPVALMTTYPALALLGRMDAQTAMLALLGGLAFAAVARRVWKRALGMYTSASS